LKKLSAEKVAVYARKIKMIAIIDKLIAIMFNAFSNVEYEISFCLPANNVSSPGTIRKEKPVAGTHIIEHNSQGDVSLKAEEKINQE
jgi:hypothetical protein